MSLNLTTSSLLENVQLVYVGGDKALALVEKCHYYIIGRVENSKTFQNQMAQYFFIGLYDIETGDDFYFSQIFFLNWWKWISKKSIFTREKWPK